MTPGKSSTGLDEPLAAALAYFFGIVSGVIFLVIEKKSRYVRFHAMQSCLVFTLVLALSIIAWSVPFIGMLLNFLLVCAAAFLWLFLMYKALTGATYKLPYLGDFAERQTRN